MININVPKLKFKNINKKQLSNLLQENETFKKIINKKNDTKKNKISNTIYSINKKSLKKLDNLSLDIFPEKDKKIYIKKKQIHKINHNYSCKKKYPKKLLNFFINLSQENKTKTRLYSFNKSYKEKNILFQKILNLDHFNLNKNNIPLMTLENAKLKKKVNCDDNIISEKKIPINKKEINKNGNKPQYLYKAPFKEENNQVQFDDKPSLFRNFISRNLKTTKNDVNRNYYNDEFQNWGNEKSEAVSFVIKYDNKGTAVTKRIFNSTFKIDDKSYENSNRNNKSRNNRKKNGDGKLKNDDVKNYNNKNNNTTTSKGLRTFGGIMLSN